MRISRLVVGLSLLLSGSAEARARWTPTAHGLPCLAMAASEPDVLLCELGDRFQIHTGSVLAMPQILAGGFSSAPGAAAGVTNGLGVTPNGARFKGAMQTDSIIDMGNSFTWFTNAGAASPGLLFQSNVADGASNIAFRFNSLVSGVTAGYKLFSLANNGTEEDFFDKAGILNLLGSAQINFTDANGQIRRSSNDLVVQASSTVQVGGGNSASTGVIVGAVGANVTSLTQQLNLSHLAGGSGAPTSPTAGTGCGTSSLPTNSGSDVAGKLGVTCGTAGTTTNPYVTITFAHAYNTAPICTISPNNAATEGGLVSSDEIPATTTTTLAVQCGGGTCATGTLSWNYICAQ